MELEDYKVGHYYKRINENGDTFVFKVLKVFEWEVIEIKPLQKIPSWVEINYESCASTTSVNIPMPAYTTSYYMLTLKNDVEADESDIVLASLDEQEDDDEVLFL